jgi:hypothetical protein
MTSWTKPPETTRVLSGRGHRDVDPFFVDVGVIRDGLEDLLDVRDARRALRTLSAGGAGRTPHARLGRG